MKYSNIIFLSLLLCISDALISSWSCLGKWNKSRKARIFSLSQRTLRRTLHPLHFPSRFHQTDGLLASNIKCEAALSEIVDNITKKSADDNSPRITKSKSIEVKHVPWSILPLQIHASFRELNEVSSWTKPNQTKTHKNSKCLTTEPKLRPKPNTEKNVTSSKVVSEGKQYQSPFISFNRQKFNLDPETHMKIIYIDHHIVVLDKPSGILSVPGPNRKPSLANLAFDTFGNESNEVDKMVVHRLDMDTSGITLYARTDAAMFQLNEDFRERRVKKTYEALVCGHVDAAFSSLEMSGVDGEIDLPLQRDHRFPPFMRVATVESEKERCDMLKSIDDGDIQFGTDVDTESIDEILQRRAHAGFQKMMGKDAKSSLTQYTVLSREVYNGFPVTRLSLVPVTGRTHQLRVHCAAIGHPILSDTIYGFDGEGSPNAGFSERFMDEVFSKRSGRASLDLQKSIKEVTDTTCLNLCLHAKELCIFHPLTGAPLIFRSKTPF